jgi:hypothetical protein
VRESLKFDPLVLKLRIAPSTARPPLPPPMLLDNDGAVIIKFRTTSVYLPPTRRRHVSAKHDHADDPQEYPIPSLEM